MTWQHSYYFKHSGSLISSILVSFNNSFPIFNFSISSLPYILKCISVIIIYIPTSFGTFISLFLPIWVSIAFYIFSLSSKFLLLFFSNFLFCYFKINWGSNFSFNSAFVSSTLCFSLGFTIKRKLFETSGITKLLASLCAYDIRIFDNFLYFFTHFRVAFLNFFIHTYLYSCFQCYLQFHKCL